MNSAGRALFLLALAGACDRGELAGVGGPCGELQPCRLPLTCSARSTCEWRRPPDGGSGTDGPLGGEPPDARALPDDGMPTGPLADAADGPGADAVAAAGAADAPGLEEPPDSGGEACTPDAATEAPPPCGPPGPSCCGDGTVASDGTCSQPCGAMGAGWRILGARDANRDGTPDLFWYNEIAGRVAVWHLAGTTKSDAQAIDLGEHEWLGRWAAVAVDRLDEDPWPDILWYEPSAGRLVIAYTNGTKVVRVAEVNDAAPAEWGWVVRGTGDFNGDGSTDILWWHPSSGEVSFWTLSGSTVTTWLNTFTQKLNASSGWDLRGAWDFTGDRHSDLLWHHAESGKVMYWVNRGGNILAERTLDKLSVGPERKIVGLAGIEALGAGSDLIWHDRTAGSLVVWHVEDLVKVTAALEIR